MFGRAKRFERGYGRGQGRENFRRDENGLLLAVLRSLGEQMGTALEVGTRLEKTYGGALENGTAEIYPLLQYLEDRGFVTLEPVGDRKVYAVTEAGFAYLASASARKDETDEGAFRGPRDADFGRDDFGPEGASEFAHLRGWWQHQGPGNSHHGGEGQRWWHHQGGEHHHHGWGGWGGWSGHFERGGHGGRHGGRHAWRHDPRVHALWAEAKRLKHLFKDSLRAGRLDGERVGRLCEILTRALREVETVLLDERG